MLFPLPGMLELRKRRGVQYSAVAVSALLGLTLARLRRRKSIISKFYHLGRDRILDSGWCLNILMLFDVSIRTYIRLNENECTCHMFCMDVMWLVILG